METGKFITRSRTGFALLRWFAVAALVMLPFTFENGFIGLVPLFNAILTAFFWMVSLIAAWRNRNPLWFALAFVAGCISRLAWSDGLIVSGVQGFQWLCYVLIFAGLPLLLFKTQMLKIGRLSRAGIDLSKVVTTLG